MPDIEIAVTGLGSCLNALAFGYAWYTTMRRVPLLVLPPKMPYDRIDARMDLLKNAIILSGIPTGKKLQRLMGQTNDAHEILLPINLSYLGDIHGTLTEARLEHEYEVINVSHNVGCLNIQDDRVTDRKYIQAFDPEGMNILAPDDHYYWVHFIPFGINYEDPNLVPETLLLGITDLLRLTNRLKKMKPQDRPKYLLGYTGDEFGTALRMIHGKKISHLIQFAEDHSKITHQGSGYYIETEQLLADKPVIQRHLERLRKKLLAYGIDERSARIHAIREVMKQLEPIVWEDAQRDNEEPDG